MPGMWTPVPGFEELLKSPLGVPQAPPPLQSRVEIAMHGCRTPLCDRPQPQPSCAVDDGRIRAGVGRRDPGIMRVIEARRIRGLVHFTPMQNLESILQFGLVPRRELEVLTEQGVTSFTPTDQHRYDGKESTCLSVCFPNAEMFFRKRCEQKSWQWVVLVLAPEDILSHPDTRFSVGNAARSGAERLSGAEGFRRLYEDSPSYQKRPRNPQAEVRVPRIIHPSLITAICCKSATDVWHGRAISNTVRAITGAKQIWEFKSAAQYFTNPRAFSGWYMPHS
jgi:hypothetical protein